MPAVRFLVAGRVQGVGFRYFASGLARRTGVAGWVFNTPEGTVEGFAQGSDASLEAFKQGLRQGPAGSRVESCEIHPSPEEAGLRGFSVRY